MTAPVIDDLSIETRSPTCMFYLDETAGSPLCGNPATWGCRLKCGCRGSITVCEHCYASAQTDYIHTRCGDCGRNYVTLGDACIWWRI